MCEFKAGFRVSSRMAGATHRDCLEKPKTCLPTSSPHLYTDTHKYIIYQLPLILHEKEWLLLNDL